MLRGLDIYDMEDKFNYPPFAAFLFVPLAILPFGVATAVWYVAKMMCLHLVVWAYLGRPGRPRELTPRRRLGLTILLSWIFAWVADSVNHDFSAGQVNLVLMAIVLADLLGRSRWRGVGVGIAAGIKVVPALFIVYLAATRQWRAAATATASFVATVLIGFAVLPSAAWQYWTSVLWDNSRVNDTIESVLNQSLRGVVYRLLRSTGPEAELLWAGLALATVALGLAVAVGLWRRDWRWESLAAVGLTIPLVTPYSWSHHWIWMVPALLVLFTRLRGTAWGLTLAVVLAILTNARLYFTANMVSGRPMWSSDGALTLSPGAQLLAAAMVLGGLAMLVLGAVASRRSAGTVTGSGRVTADPGAAAGRAPIGAG